MIDRMLNSCYFFSYVIRNLGIKSLFHCHNEFDKIQRISPEIINERGGGNYFCFINTELLNNNINKFFFFRHVFLLLFPDNPSCCPFGRQRSVYDFPLTHEHSAINMDKLTGDIPGFF